MRAAVSPGAPTPQRGVLAHDDGVEVLPGDLAELAHVVVAPVACRGDDGDATVPGVRPPWSRSARSRSTKSPRPRMPAALWQ
jgi:hypothetical protein